jgi:hypothetical protein
MALPVLFDPVGQILKTPIFGVDDFAAVVFDQAGKRFDQTVDLRARYVLARNKNMLVKWHSGCSSWLLTGHRRSPHFRAAAA